MIKLDDWQSEILAVEGNLLLCSGRQTGKSTIVAIKAANEAANHPNFSILIISATERQAEELFIKVLNYLYEKYKFMVKTGKDRPTKKRIMLKNGSVIRCLPTGTAGIGIRGFTINGLIADEAAFIPEEVWQAVTPMLLTTGGWIWLISTPHGKLGYFYERYKDPTYKVFHIKSEEVIKNRPISAFWTEKQREHAIAHLEQEKARMSKNQYLQEYCGVFIEELRQFFSDEIIRKCMNLKRPESIRAGRNYFLGVDVARMGEDECTFEIVDKISRNNLVHVESIILKKQYLNQVTEKILELDKIYQFVSIYIDDGGIGVGVFDYLLSHEQTKRKVIAINNRSRPLDRDEEYKKRLLKEDLYNNLLGLMERSEISLLDDDEVFQSLKSVQYEYITTPGALTKLRIFGNYTHIVEGLIRAVWCVRDKRLNIWVR